MVPYRGSKEDDLLMKPYRIYNGVKIDIRWSGGWLTPEGVYHPVDYLNGITHETIAEEHGSKIRGSGSIMFRPPMLRLFDLAKWMRITYFEGSSFCVQLMDDLVEPYGKYNEETGEEIECFDVRRQTQLLRFVNDYKNGFECYFINDVEYKTYHEFVKAIKDDNVTPMGYSASDPVEPDPIFQGFTRSPIDPAKHAKAYETFLNSEDEDYGIPTFLRNRENEFPK